MLLWNLWEENEMFVIIRNEINKIFSQKLIYIFMALIALLYILMAIYAKVYPDGKLKGFDMTGQAFSMSILGELLAHILPLFILILVAILFTEEYANGTLKLSLIRPVSRISIFISKVTAFAVSLAILMIFTLIAGYIAGTAFFGWGTGLHIDKLSFDTLDGIILTIRSYMIDMIPYFAFGIMLLFITLFFSNSGAAIGVGLGTCFIVIITSEIAEEVRDYIISSYFSFHTMFIADMNLQKIITGCITILVYFTVFFTASLVTFIRKDILI